MRVLMMTQAVDPADPLLAFTVDWIKALAVRVDRVDVMCLRASDLALPSNVNVWPFGMARWGGRARRLAAFVRTVRLLVPSTDVVVSHMIPRYAWLAAPFALRHGRRVVLWYVHRDVTPELRLATACSKRVVTAVPSSFPLATRKLSAIGHGVDAGFFAPDPGVVPETPPSIVLVGRLMPIKHQATLVRAARRLGPPFDRARVILAGGIPPGAGADYASHLQEAVEALGLSSRVTFTGAIPPEEVRERYRRATVAVNLGPEGLFDKAAIESMMAETPTIVCSRAFDDLLGEHAPVLRIDGPEDDPGLAAALTRVLAMSSGSRRAMAAGVAARARAAHGLQGMMDRFVALLRGLADAA